MQADPAAGGFDGVLNLTDAQYRGGTFTANGSPIDRVHGGRTRDEPLMLLHR
ncbi:hypothetical protein NOVOSPHI9U_10540 [Novosphingobium sp. 9U]|nr:hypothetical protein NOVOSPHI9U_10540 [Novosphingobium sp. 9U]